MELRVDPMRFGALFKNLIHAIRNACDHGLETVEDRVDNGKREVGLLRVTIDSTPEKQLHVRVLDDGKGISLQKLSEKALREGLLDKGGLAKVLETDPFSLVFVDGLSSAEKVSDTSGRGTGMSCIKMEVERLGGVIKVTSKPQVGTRLDILVPQ
jgi:two-component system chemotaxis sensor kinase CheA